MPLQATSGAASYDGFGGGVVAEPNYIESCFSTYLYTPATSNTAINIPNGVDLSTKGGMVWFKKRSGGTQNHSLVDTVRGGTNLLTPNDTFAAYTASIISSFNTDGFTTGTSSFVSIADQNFVSWTFRKQPKFFDVVTYTGNDAASRNIAHNLGSVPGCIIIKNTSFSGAQAWVVWHRTQNDKYLQLWKTDAVATDGGSFYPSSPTSTNFTIGPAGAVNDSSSNYVAYLFAHDAGGFGLTGTDNVISCGSFTTGAGGSASVNIGFEPQYLLVKCSSAGQNWNVFDVMRGFSMTTNVELYPNTSDSDQVYSVNRINPTATGFEAGQVSASPFFASQTYIYIAIRRGPMKVPTVGTSVLNITTSVGTNPAYVSSFPVDFAYRRQITGTSDNYFHTRLQGAVTLYPNYATDEGSDANVTWAYQNGMFTSTGANANQYGWLMRRAPSFMDVVCYTGDGADDRQVTHNLGATPELVIVKPRSVAWQWWVYHTGLGNTRQGIVLNSTGAKSSNVDAFSTNGSSFSSSYFLQSASSAPYPPNANGYTYVAYLFATCAGVSKVGSYTGNGSTQTIDCGFTGGARFVMIKRTDSTGGWYVYDTVRGMTTLVDPYVFLNSNAVQVATLGSVTTVSTGFALDSSILADINISAGNYIFLAIA